jgi:hypothetical protein
VIQVYKLQTNIHNLFPFSLVIAVDDAEIDNGKYKALGTALGKHVEYTLDP